MTYPPYIKNELIDLGFLYENHELLSRRSFNWSVSYHVFLPLHAFAASAMNYELQTREICSTIYFLSFGSLISKYSSYLSLYDCVKLIVYVQHCIVDWTCQVV